MIVLAWFQGGSRLGEGDRVGEGDRPNPLWFSVVKAIAYRLLHPPFRLHLHPRLAWNQRSPSPSTSPLHSPSEDEGEGEGDGEGDSLEPKMR